MPNVKILEAVALKSKTYNLRLDNEREYSCAKGVITSVKEKKLRMEHYRNCVKEFYEMYVKQRHIRSINHVNKMMESNKIAFSSFDDKRFLLCPIHSVPYGSKLIEEGKKECMFCKNGKNLI